MPRSNPALQNPPKYLRGAIARGLAAGDGAAPASPVDREGGDAGAGLIRGTAVITRGEALGHGYWIDADFLQAVTDAMNADPNGVKARFTHPGLSSDGLGKFIGRVKNGTLDGDVVRGDLHFSATAHETPDGDLAGYLMALAEKDPAAFGQSIVFEHDFKAEQDFMLANGAHWEEDEWGRYLVGFVSPDPENVHNYPHTRMTELRAVDSVDEPAANPEGLFHRGQDAAQEAEALAAYCLGLSPVRPQLAQLAIDPDRVTGFFKRFLDRHGLSIVSTKGETMPPLKNALTGKPSSSQLAEAPVDEKETDEEVPPEKKPETEAGEKEEETEASEEDDEEETTSASSGRQGTALTEGQRFLKAFGTQGAVWFAEGKTFAEAEKLHAASVVKERDDLKADNAKLKKQLQAARGEERPLSFSGNPDEGRESAENKFNNLGPSLSKFAAGIKLPGKSK